MAYQQGYYYPYCRISTSCSNGTFWFPDGSSDIRNQITAAYFFWFGRYGESPNVDSYKSQWENGGAAKFGTIQNMVYLGGDSTATPPGSGEIQAVNSFGKHCGMSLGSCPPLPSATFTTNDSTIVLGTGETTTLQWSTGGVTSVSINQGIGGVALNGSRTVAPTSTTTYTLTATGERGTVTRTVTINVVPPPAPTVSFSISPTEICPGNTATLSWSVTGVISSISINQGIGTVSASGTRTVSPNSTTTYTITATNAGGTTTRSVTLTRYQLAAVDLTTDVPTIIRGQSTTLRWTATGTITSSTINQGIGSVNINGNRVISPTETTTYTIITTGVCNTATDSVTLIVYQPPTVDITGPESLNYGQQGTLTYQSTDADISLIVIPTYTYKQSTTVGAQVSLSIGQTSNGTLTTQIPYNDFGPVSVSYAITATGNGGQESKQIIIPINIDETPTNVLVPESEDLLKSQNPIYTPDSLITSYEILIEDIDIPVEVKADKPILIDVNAQETWTPIRRIE